MLVSYSCNLFIIITNVCKGLVMFNQSTYEADESKPMLQVQLVVNVPLSRDFVLHIEASSVTATGKCMHINK